MTTFAQLGIEFISKGAAQAANDIQNVKEAAAGADQATAKLGTTSKRLATDFLTGRKGVKLATDELDRMTGSARKLGPQIQNASYQVGDFFVQIGSGTDPMRAMAQQLPQLLGGMGVFGAVAGGVAAVIGALVPMLFNMESGAARLTKEIDTLKDAQDALSRSLSIANMPINELIEKYGSGAARVRELATAQMQLNIAIGRGELAKSLAEIRDATAEYTKLGVGFSTYARALDAIQRDFGLVGDQAETLRTKLIEVNKAATSELRLDRFKELATWLEAAGVPLEKMPPHIAEAAAKMLEVNINAEELRALIEQASAEVSGAVPITGQWATAMSGVKAEIYGIASALSQIGGGMLSNAAKFVEINALKEGKSLAEASLRMKEYNADLEYNAKLMEARAKGGVMGWAQEQLATFGRTVEQTGLKLDIEAAALRKTATEAERLANKHGKVAGAKKAGTSATEKLTRQLDREAEKWKANLGPVEKYRSEMAKLEKVRSRLTGDEMAKAVKDLNVELADSLPLVGDLTEALVDGLFSGFKSGMKSILGVFKNWLAQMIATAAKNRIVMSMGFTGGGVGAAAAGVPGVPAGGMLGGIGSGLSAFGGGLWGGASSVVTGLMGGGLSGGLGAITSALGGATSGLAGLGTALGAIAAPIAAVAAVVSFFSSKTKLLDSGLRVTATSMDALIETFKYTEKSRFWGLSKKRRTSYSAADDEVADPIIAAITKAQQSIMDMAKVVGFAGSVFDDFTHQLTISTKDLNKDEILQAIATGVTEATDAFAAMIPGLAKLSKEGEGASDTLTRLVTSITTVNGAFDTLGYALRYAGLAGADTASGMAELFGGLDAFSSATSSYWQVFYSEAERQKILTRQATSALEKYNTALPRSRDEYRALVDAQDLTTEAGRKLWAVLIQMSGTMDAILPGVSALTRELEKLQGNVSTALDGAIESITAMVNVNAQAASDWYAAAGKARDLIASLRGTAGSVTTKQQALLYNQTKYLTTYAAALAGDLKAAQNITGAAQSYLTSVHATARTREDAALAQARVLSQMELLGGAADIEGARHDIMAGLYQKQVDLMTDARDYIAAGNALTKDMIDKLQGGLGSIDDAIDAASKISYANLKKQIDLSLDVVQDAKIPQYLKNLLKDTTKGVDAFVDFIVRSDLKPDMKWLALNGSSEHLKTVTYLAKNNLGAGLTKVAVDTIGALQKTVHLLVGRKLPNDVLRIALAQNSELSRTVNATLAANISPGAKRLALENTGRYVTTILANYDRTVTPAQRKLFEAITGSTVGKITLGGSFVFDPAKGFTTLMQNSMQNPLKNAQAAMDKLRTALDKFRAAVIDPAPAPKPPTPSKPSGGGGGGGGGGTKPPALSWRDFVMASRSDMFTNDGNTYSRSNFTVMGPNGGKRQITVGSLLDKSYLGLSNDAVLQKLFNAGKLPAFAAGGDHAGGLRIVGEHGPELEATGPSRIYNARQTSQILNGSNDELVAEVRALRAELAAIRVQAGRTADSVRSSEKLWKKIDATGIATREGP